MHFKKHCKCILLLAKIKNPISVSKIVLFTIYTKYLLVHFEVGLQNYAHFSNMNYGTACTCMQLLVLIELQKHDKCDTR